jgi:rhodanese-related sulfurtransferase
MKTITRHQLKAKLDAGEDIKLVMTVGGWTFRAKHIPGSLSFPSPGCALQTLRCDHEIILYSTSDGRQDTRAAVDALTAHGYRNVRCYEGGLADWEDAGYPVEGTSVGSAAPRRWPHGHSPDGIELEGGCPHCDNGWSGYGWPPAETADRDYLGNQAAMAGGQPERQVVQPYKMLASSRPLHRR